MSKPDLIRWIVVHLMDRYEAAGLCSTGRQSDYFEGAEDMAACLLSVTTGHAMADIKEIMDIKPSDSVEDVVGRIMVACNDMEGVAMSRKTGEARREELGRRPDFSLSVDEVHQAVVEWLRKHRGVTAERILVALHGWDETDVWLDHSDGKSYPQ